MDYETEKILKLIFADGIPTHLQESPELVPQVVKLGACKVDEIKKEEMHLIEENRSIVEQTQDLAITNYKAFIQTSECSRKIVNEFQQMEGQLDHLIEKLPDLSARCESFIKTSRELNTSRRLNSLTLRRNAQLLEILELPQLMDTCIYQGKYEEALELAAQVQRMGQKHGSIPVINNIVKAIEGSWHTMLSQLLAQLNTDLTLSKCLQVIGYIRRMQAFLPVELKLKFLQARDTWFRSLLDNIPMDDPQTHLLRTIEVSRVNLFNIITQYRATFGDDDSNESGDGGNIFHSWINEKINEFLTTLELDLERNIGSFDAVIGQCMYFGLSFSRVGADFRGLLVPIFTKLIRHHFQSSIVKATDQFELDMENYTFINKLTINTFSTTSRTDSNSLAPPETLLSFQPLALYCNGVLSALNELQNCAPIALTVDVALIIEASLIKVSQNIIKFYRQEQQALGAKERDNFVKFCCAFAYELVPYLQRCMQEIFKLNLLAMNLSISAAALQKFELGQMKKIKILEPLESLLPEKIETIIGRSAEVTAKEVNEPSLSQSNDEIADTAAANE